MGKRMGTDSILLKEEVYIREAFSVVGPKEKEGPLGLLFDMAGEEEHFGQKTWEEAESFLQKTAVEELLRKAGRGPEEIDFVFCGDLLGQSIASSFGSGQIGIQTFGVYGACSNCGESLNLGSMLVSGGFANRVVCVTSSHFASAEKEFRYPMSYGNQRPLSASWTVTGSGAFLLDREKTGAKCRVEGLTPGRIVDYGLKDSMNMGACMAPAAASTIEAHLRDFGRAPEDYDRIITGDLGSVGQKVLFDLLMEKGIDITQVHMDCGIEIFDGETQDTHAGGSGCGCSAVTLAAYILRQLSEGYWKRVLFLPTGALLSKTSFNEGRSVPGVAHGLSLCGI